MTAIDLRQSSRSFDTGAAATSSLAGSRTALNAAATAPSGSNGPANRNGSNSGQVPGMAAGPAQWRAAS